MERKTNVRLTLGSGPLVFVALAGCVSTSLELPHDHPANPRAATLPLGSSNALQASSTVPAPKRDSAANEQHDRREIRRSKPESGEVWTCPMHPEVVRGGPGQCPICGMNLVKRAKTPEQEGGH